MMNLDWHTEYRVRKAVRTHLTDCFYHHPISGFTEDGVHELLDWFDEQGPRMAEIADDERRNYALAEFVWDNRNRAESGEGFAATAEVHCDISADDGTKLLWVVIHDPRLATLYKLTWC